MKTNLENFPKATGDKYLPDHKHGVNSSERELAEIGIAAIQWRSDFEKELKDMLEETQDRENGCNCYSCEQKVGAFRLIREILMVSVRHGWSCLLTLFSVNGI